MSSEPRKKKGKPLTVQQMAQIALKDLLPKQKDQSAENDPRSAKLKNLLKRIPQIPIRKLEKWKDEVFDLGRKEGFDDMVIGKWIRKAMTDADYSDRHVQRLLPDTAKYTTGSRSSNHVASDITDKMSDSVPQEEPVIRVQEQPPQQQPQLELEQEPDDEAPTGYYQIPTEQFKEEDIEQYDRIFLIRVLKAKCAEIRELRGRIERLEK